MLREDYVDHFTIPEVDENISFPSSLFFEGKWEIMLMRGILENIGKQKKKDQ